MNHRQQFLSRPAASDDVTPFFSALGWLVVLLTGLALLSFTGRAVHAVQQVKVTACIGPDCATWRGDGGR